MSVVCTLAKDGSYVLVEHAGTLKRSSSAQKRKAATQDLGACHRALVDFRLADLNLVNLIEVDNIASCLKKTSPQLTRVATVRKKGNLPDHFKHAVNLYHLQGIEAALFEDIESAENWLLSE